MMTAEAAYLTEPQYEHRCTECGEEFTSDWSMGDRCDECEREYRDSMANPAPIGSCYDCHVALLATDDYGMDTRKTVDDYGDVLVCRDCTAHPSPRLRVYRSFDDMELPL